MARQLIHHRGAEFTEVMAEVGQGLKWLFETDSQVLTLTCSGTGAFEAAMTNFTSPGDTVVSIGGGKFGERWGDVGRAFDMEVVDVDVKWGEFCSPSRLRKVLADHRETAMVTLTASETSTGVLHPVEELARVVRQESNALFAVDGITSVGVHRMPMDAWDIDVLVAGSQKALGIPPGLGFVAANERAWQREADSEHPRYYFALRREKQRQTDNQTAFTPAISVVLALREVLAMLKEEGRKGLRERHRLNAAAIRAGVEALDLELLSQRPGHAVTAALTGDDVDASEVVERMRLDHGVIIAGGQKHLAGDLIRIGHIGFFEASDIRMALGALEQVIDDLRGGVESGAALAAAQKIFSSQTHNR